MVRRERRGWSLRVCVSASSGVASATTVASAAVAFDAIAADSFTARAVAFDANLRVAIGYSLAVSLAYLLLVVLPCAGAAGADPGRLSDACVDETQLYKVLPWLAVGKNLYGYLPGKQVYRRSRSPAKRKVQ